MRTSSLAAIVFTCLSIVGAVAFAAEPMPPPDEDKRVGLAAALVEYGVESRDSLALANAARMYRSFSARVLEKGESGEGGKAVDADELLQQAREFAGSDERLLAVIDHVDEMESGAKGWVYVPTCCWQWYCDFFGCRYIWLCK